MYGVYHIIQENPDIKRVLLGGAVYGGFSVAEYTGTLLASRAEGEIIRREQEDIRGRLELFEKKVSGRAIGARVLDPNNIPVTEKLDDVVRKDVEKELAKKEKKKLIETYSLSKDVEKIMHRLAFCIWWQDNRKKHIFIANHFIDELLEKVSEIYNIPFDDLHYYRFEDLTELLNNHKLVHSSEIKTRKDYKQQSIIKKN